MYLKSLQLSGFKSFAKKSNLEFKTPITAIVGPNGSGKSNLAEAFRFVLGEQSIKSLRGKKGEDMIWNGGSERDRSNRAHVKLVFDNSRRVFPTIDFDELSVERAVNRDGTNEYLLNGSQVRLKDVVELLGSAHIGSTGHHIISQGEADRILQASPREKREMIEDALGLKIYQWKKIESIKKLEKTEENITQVESLRREIAPHLRFLKKQVEKVEKAEELRKELISFYKEYFKREDNYIRAEKSRLEEAIKGPKQELEDLDKVLNHARQVLSMARGKDYKSEELIALEKSLSDNRSLKDGLMRELGRIEGEILANKRVRDKEREKQEKDEFKTVYLKDIEILVDDIRKLESLSDAKALFDAVIMSLRNFIGRHKGTTDSALIAQAESDIANLERNKEEYDRKLREAGLEENEIRIKYASLRQSIEKEKDTNREAEKDVFRIIARQNEVRNIFNDLDSKLSSINRENESFKKDLYEAGMIIGRDAVDYESVSVGDEDALVRQELRRKIERNKIRLEDAGGLGGGEILKEFRETEERDAFLAREIEDLNKARAEIMELIKDLDVRIDVEFKSGISKINVEFQKYFDLMFGGGRAELSIVKETMKRPSKDLDDLSSVLNDSEYKEEELEEGPEGLDVSVNLPRKKVKGLMMLSGGERALTSIALLFAISQVNPPPFIILDETDAALDEANSKKYGDMIESLSRHSQLILITHNRETMSRAGVLYGVTMGSDGSSKLLSIAFEQALTVAK